MGFRHSLYRIVEHDYYNRFSASKVYDILMLAAIALGVFPLMFKTPYPVFRYFETAACAAFIFDYLAKWITADMKFGNRSIVSFLRYPFTPWAVLDLLTILPGLNMLGKAFVTLRIARLLKIVRVLRLLEHSRQIVLLVAVLKRESKVLWSVLMICLFYIFTTALIMFNTENSFDNFFDALYWATTALTTVGYGDICPQTDIGRLVSMLSSLFGVAIIALPSGIITAGYLEEIKQQARKRAKDK